MRLIVLLLALLIVGWLVYTQLGANKTVDLEVMGEESVIETPKIPTAPADLPKFEKDMNQYMKDTSDKRAKEMEEALGQ